MGEAQKKPTFELSLDTLRALAGWAADCAERALPLWEGGAEAIVGAREFAAGGPRTAALRRLALAAYATARAETDPAVRAAAMAASLAASSAYTHPLADVGQTTHIVGPAAYAALALELGSGGSKKDGNQASTDEILHRAAERASPEVRGLLARMPRRQRGKGRANELMQRLDALLRDVENIAAYPVWERYLRSIGEDPSTTAKRCMLVDHFCNDRESADSLYELALSGVKRATTGSLWVCEQEGEPVLRPGDLSILTDFDGGRSCVLKTLGVDIKPFGEVTSRDAEVEGEGDKSLAYWRAVHRKYFEAECASIGREFSDDMPVVFEEFRVEYRD